MSVGLEATEDILEDFEQALSESSLQGTRARRVSGA
jgi:hypothetical protein